jgi:hypothetical protein
MVNRNSLHDLLFCCLVFMFHGCLLVEGFVAVRRFRQAEDVLVGDCDGLERIEFESSLN